MAKKSKRSTKEKKNLMSKGVKKKQKPKKLGLAKFIHHVSNKKFDDKLTDQHNDDKMEVDTNNSDQLQIIKNLKNSKKNLSLLDRCKLQMSSSMLRMVDEDLYTSDSSKIPLDKDKFIAYHQAYATVCDKWPTKPIDFIVKYIKKRMLSMKAQNKLSFADIGCGPQPLLKMKLPGKCRVQSFDLVSTHADIVDANMERIPINSQTIDCSVYSLSLMAKNLGKILLEGKRILKVGGSMLIVEVTSRFEDKEKKFISQMDKIGMKKKSTSVLKPNGYFTFFHFIKTDLKDHYPSSLLNIQLKPCVYKSR